jgi:hypothetical protein
MNVHETSRKFPPVLIAHINPLDRVAVPHCDIKVINFGYGFKLITRYLAINIKYIVLCVTQVYNRKFGCFECSNGKEDLLSPI